MITREIPLRTIDQEIAALEALSTGPNMGLIRNGALMALLWVRNMKDGPTPAETVASGRLP